MINPHYHLLTPPEIKHIPEVHQCRFCDFKTDNSNELFKNIFNEKACKQCMDEMTKYEIENGEPKTFKI